MGRQKARPRRRQGASSRDSNTAASTLLGSLGGLPSSLFEGGLAEDVLAREEEEKEEEENKHTLSAAPPAKRAKITPGVGHLGGNLSRASLASLSLVPVTINLFGNEGGMYHQAQPAEPDFELARVETEVEVGADIPLDNTSEQDKDSERTGNLLGPSRDEGGSRNSRYSLRLTLKPNRFYKRKKGREIGNTTTLLECCLVDGVEGKQGACTLQSLSGTYNEVESVVIALHQKWLCLDKITITEPPVPVPAGTSSSGKKGSKNKKNQKRRKVLSFSVCLTREALDLSQPSAAYEKPGRSVEHRIHLLFSCLTFIRPDFFFTQSGSALDEKLSAESLKEEAHLVSKDHLEMAMHTVGQGSEQINTALLYAAIAPETTRGSGQRKEGEEGKDDVDDMIKFSNIPGLVPKLRAYQKRAVKWMLEREESLGVYEEECPLWKNVCDISARRRSLHVNVCTGQLSRYAFPRNTKVPGGILADEMGLGKTVELLSCILLNRCPLDVKEEEGEGEGEAKESKAREEKHEVETDLFTNGEYDGSYSGTWVFCEDCKSWLKLEETGYKRSENLPDQYICGPCVRERAKDSSLLHKQCKTTLIICPDPILEQWQEELARHTYHGYLRVFTYLGQKASLSTGGSPEEIITAQTLSEYDVVLSTYSVLSADLYKDSDISDTLEENQKSLRFTKRYQKVPTPLTRLKWWRVCLDEAQMVHNRTAKSAEMALKLSTQYRWCVTGTPINRGLEDLYGLMVFLQIHPYDYKYWWTKLVQTPCDEGTTRGFSNLTTLLQPSSGGIMWRTRKHDVKDDLNLQPQMVKITNLRLSPVERHFYKKQHQECYAVAKEALPKHLLNGNIVDEDEERTLKPREAGKIFIKLLRLRQACCHPQVGSQGIRSLSQTSKPLTMDEILDMLIAKAKIDAEDILRIVIFCLNGLASIFQLENQKQDAVKAYREALQYSSTHAKSGIKTDALQKLHTLHNLALLLKESIPGIASTLRDSQLESEAKELKKEYLKNASGGLIIANSDFLSRKNKVLERNHEDRVGQNWWIEVLMKIENCYDSSVHFVDQIKSRLNDRTAAGTSLHGRNSTSLVHRFSDIGGLKYVLSSELITMFESREQAMKELLKLEEECQRESPDFIYEASHCGRCRGELGTGLVRCAFCKLDDLLMRYEARIFSLRTQATNTKAVLNADDATRAQESASGFAGGWGRMAGRSVESSKGKIGKNNALDDLGRGARNRAETGVTHADVFHAPSETEIVLEFIASIASKGKYRSLNFSFRAEFDTIVKSHLSLLENMRAEFKPARAYAQAQRQYIYSFDELDMAMMKMQLRAEGEELFHEHEKYFKLYESELVVRNKELTDEKIIAHADLTRAVGTLRYLDGLAAARRRSKSGGAGEEMEETVCPVCQENISEDMAVLPCGHVFCSKCVMALIARSGDGRAKRSKRKILCPNCRNSIHVSEIAYADDSILKEHEHEEKANQQTAGVQMPGSGENNNHASDPQLDFDIDDLRIKGSYGSKLEAVARRVLSILSRDATAKVLVFSEWQDVLDLLAHALSANHVPFVYVKGKPGMSKALKQFKMKASGANNTEGVPCSSHSIPQPSLGASVLMLPVKLGANGLNLIEAQHVILIEPLLDPAKEAQAFGRVDRIGQTKKTFVHRFIVSGTIEEKVYLLAQQRASMYSIMGVPASRGGSNKKFSEEQSLTIKDIKELLIDS